MDTLSPAARTAEAGAVVEEIRRRQPANGRVVFVSGNFNIVHPGHLRLLNFAAQCGDFLVVGVHPDGHPGTLVAQEHRLSAIESHGFVGYAFILDAPVATVIRLLRPDVVVKGKEHENLHNPERAAVDSYGGKLLFTSGDVRFSSRDLLRREFQEMNLAPIAKPVDYPVRHDFSFEDLITLVQSFVNLQVVVLGDLIVDEYVDCEPLGMSREDPTLVVTPIQNTRFVGGAGIVAAHVRGLGARVKYFSVTGDDELAAYAGAELAKFGVECDLLSDDSRRTTLKQRFRAGEKTLLRVSHLDQHEMHAELAEHLARRVQPALEGADLVIFSDFNYGCLPQRLVDFVIECCTARGIITAAESQSSSQHGDVSRFRGARLLSATEYEARLAVRDFRTGLVTLADSLCRQAEAVDVILTLGAEGVLVHSPDAASAGEAGEDLVTDRLPSFNTAPRDVAGAGDSLISAAALSLAAGADIWRSAYLGSVAAACQISRIGNYPLKAEALIRELSL